MDFLDESVFDRQEYESLLRRLHYDDRDTVMYDRMLQFLWIYILDPDSLEDRQGILEEYTHWNLQMIDKCFYHLPHDLPYANIRRAYQSLICLFQGDLDAGAGQLEMIGKETFMQDGVPPRLHMGRHGRVYRPTSRLFLIYNYEKAFRMKEGGAAESFREKNPYAFKVFGDKAHEDHDRFLKSQMEDYADVIFYPEYERVYRLPGGVSEFFLYFDEEKGLPVTLFS